MRFEAERDDDDGGIPDLPSGLERTGNAPPYPGSPKFGYGRSANGKKNKNGNDDFRFERPHAAAEGERVQRGGADIERERKKKRALRERE